MMNRKTLAGVGSLAVLGAVVLAQGTTTLGSVRDAVRQNPSAWYVVVGADAKASDVLGAADIIAALQYYTVQRTVEPVNLSAVKVVLQHPVLNETDLGYSNATLEEGTVKVNDTLIKYTVGLEVPSRSISLNESNKLQVENVEFRVTLGFNETIDKLNNTKIVVLGKEFYVTVNDSSYSEIVLRRIPIQEYNVYLNQQVTVLGHTVRLVDIQERAGVGYIVILEVDGEEAELSLGERKTVRGLELTVLEARRSWANPANTYVKIGIGGGEVYKLVKTDGSYNVTDPSGNVIGTATLSTDYKTLTLTFTKDYLFAGDEFILPIFGGYKIVFKPYALPPAGSTLVEVKYLGTETIDSTVYRKFELSYEDAILGRNVALKVFYNNSEGWALGEKEATTIYKYKYDSSSTPQDVFSVSSEDKVYMWLTDDTSASRLLKVEVNDRTNVQIAVITDLLTGERVATLDSLNPSVKIKLGDKEVEFKIEGNILKANYTGSPSTASTIKLYAKDGKEITVGVGGTTGSNNVNVLYATGRTYTITLDATNEEVVPPSSPPSDYSSIREGTITYKVAYHDGNYLRYPLDIRVTSVSLYLRTKDTPDPEVKLQDLLHSKTESYEVGLGGSVQVENVTLTVANLTGVPTQVETVKVGTPLIGGAILDTEVTAGMNNLIVVGGPAVNRLAAELLGVQYPTYGDTLKQMGVLAEGEGLIKVFTTPRVAVLVMGWEAEDTRAAARVLSLFLTGQAYPELADRTEVKVTGGLQNTQVS